MILIKFDNKDGAKWRGRDDFQKRKEKMPKTGLIRSAKIMNTGKQ